MGDFENVQHWCALRSTTTQTAHSSEVLAVDIATGQLLKVPVMQTLLKLFWYSPAKPKHYTYNIGRWKDHGWCEKRWHMSEWLWKAVHRCTNAIGVQEGWQSAGGSSRQHKFRCFRHAMRKRLEGIPAWGRENFTADTFSIKAFILLNAWPAFEDPGVHILTYTQLLLDE